jgi:hypothetical protein
MHGTEPVGGPTQSADLSGGAAGAAVPAFLSAPLVQALQAAMCGVGALHEGGVLGESVATGGLMADVCRAVRVAVERLYQDCYDR